MIIPAWNELPLIDHTQLGFDANGNLARHLLREHVVRLTAVDRKRLHVTDRQLAPGRHERFPTVRIE
jgi:hypothetical protein